MSFLFERNDFYREGNDVIELINLMNPGLCNYIDRFNQSYGNRDFSILLQRTESYLMLDNVCRIIHLENPDIPFYTIHDSIITTQPNIELVKKITSETILKITGKPVGVKTKVYDPSVIVSEQLLTDTWDKVKITSVIEYERKKSSFLHKNIRKGIELIFVEGDRGKWFERMSIVQCNLIT